MRIDHAAAYVRDLEAAREFFVRYLGAAAGELYHNQTTGFRSYFLTFDDGARLELMARPELENVASAPCCGWAHLAFSLGSREAVESLTATLAAAGYAILSGPRITGDGYYESAVAAAEGLVIELTV